MGPNEMDLMKWKNMAQQVLGDGFFKDFFTDMSGTSDGPKYNLYRNSSEIMVLINLPYIKDLSEVQLFVREMELIIKGNIDYDCHHLDLVQGQLFSGKFEKKIPLPEPVNTKKVNATYRKGILQVQLFPKLRKDGKNVSIRDLR